MLKTSIQIDSHLWTKHHLLFEGHYYNIFHFGFLKNIHYNVHEHQLSVLSSRNFLCRFQLIMQKSINNSETNKIRELQNRILHEQGQQIFIIKLNGQIFQSQSGTSKFIKNMGVTNSYDSVGCSRQSNHSCYRQAANSYWRGYHALSLSFRPFRRSWITSG